MSIFLFIVILFVLVLVHELGHFVVAKLFGIRVDEFGFGYPPRAAKLFSWRGTLFTLNWLPFGGFVKIFGEDPTEESTTGPEKNKSFVNKPKYVQALVLVAGITMNFLLGWVLLFIGYTTGLPTAVGTEPAGSVVVAPELTITGVEKGKPAELAGLIPGDVVLKLQATDTTVETPNVEKIKAFISDHGDKPVTVTIRRVAEEKTITVTPKAGTVEGQKAGVGVSLDMIGRLHLPWYQAITQGFRAAYTMTYNIFITFVHMIYDLVRGQGNLSQVTGPVGIVGVVGDAYKIGFVYLLSLAALISLNLTVINLIPFPALDGGRLLFVAIESIIRRPIPAKIANAFNIVGFGLLILLMLVVTFHDVVRLVK